MIEEGLANEKVKQGWIKAKMMFEVLGINEEASRSALEKMISRLDSDDPRIEMYSKDVGEISKIINPLPNIKEGYSLICEVELISKNLDNLTQIVMEYGPSSIELLEPRIIDLPISQAQGILNSISRLVHQFAASGAGGLVFIAKDKQ